MSSVFLNCFADSTLKCNPLSSKKKREAGDAKLKHFLGTAIREVCCDVNSLHFFRGKLPKAQPCAKQWPLAIFLLLLLLLDR